MEPVSVSRWSSARFWSLAAILVFVNVLGLIWIRSSLLDPHQPRIRVLGVQPQSGLRSADRISILFSDELASPHQVGRPLAESPFAVEPNLPGDWVWSAPDRLELRLTSQVPPGRRYELAPVEGAELWQRYRLVGNTKTTLDSGALRLLACSLDTREPQQTFFTLTFDQLVRPSELQRHLTVHADESREPSAVRVLGNDAAATHLVEIPQEVRRGFDVIVSAELLGDGATLPLGTRALRSVLLPKQLLLTSNRPQRATLQRAAGVRLDFSERLDVSKPLPRFQLAPAVPDAVASYASGDLVVRGSFLPGQTYRLTLPPAALFASSGGSLEEAQTTWFEVPEPDPEVAFPWARGFLSPAGNLELPLRVLNTRELQLTAARIHDNNLIAHLHGARDSVTGLPILDKTVDLIVAGSRDQEVVLDLRELLQQPRGIYRVSARAKGRYWARDDALIAVTDLAITAKRETSETLAWVTSIRTGGPRLGVRVSAWSHTNQKLAEATTDFDGIARLAVDPRAPDGAPWMILAESEDDRSYVLLDRHRWPVTATETGGRREPSTYDAYVYTERGVYRPGDAVHVTGILRDAQGHVPPTFPLQVRVRRPDGRVVAELPINTPNSPAPAVTGETTHVEARIAQGMFHATFASEPSDATGRYRFEVALPGSDEVLGEAIAQIEAFTPVRFEVECAPTRERYSPDETPTVSVSARYLAGAAARELPVEVAVQLSAAPIAPPALTDFRFGPIASSRREPTHGRSPWRHTTSTNAEGTATVAVDASTFPSSGRWEAHTTATVTEIAGRSVTGHTSFVFDASGAHVGLHLASAGFTPSATEIPLEWVVVDASGSPVPSGPIDFEVLRRETDWRLEEVDGRPVWRTMTNDQEVWRHSLAPTTERGSIAIRFPEPGEYVVRATHVTTESTTDFAVWAGDARGVTGAAASAGPDRLEVELDQERVLPGSSTRARIRSPFAGTLLVTLENDRVWWHRVVTLTSESTELDIPVDANICGGAFVTATVVRPVDPAGETWLPHRAIGMARLRIDHNARTLAVAIEAAPRVEPDGELAVTVRAPAPIAAERPSVVHLWAVDEGILLADRFATPSPQEYFFAPRRLSVRSSDPFGDLLPDWRIPASLERIGGDGAPDLESMRRSPIEVEHREAAVVWRGAIALDATGSAHATIRVPDSIGELRLMAVVVDQERFGATEHAVTVASDIVALASWPRFVAPNDTFRVPVRLLNHTTDPAHVRLEFEVRGPIDIGLLPAEPFLVPPAGSVVAFLDARALAPGRVDVTTHAIGQRPNERAREFTRFTVRPVTSLHRETRFVRLTAGESLRLAPNTPFVDNSLHTEVSVGGLPTVELRPALEQIIDYPYGCVEQTTSRLLAMLHIPELLHATDGEGRARGVERLIGSGVDRLHRMTTGDGGIAYWPGNSVSHRWGSTYAALTLAQAKRQGFSVDDSLRRGLTQYLIKQLNASGVTDDERAMICHAAAALGHPDFGWITMLDERRSSLDKEGRAHLIGAWWEAGRADRAHAALDDATLGDGLALEAGARLTSSARQDAVLLGVLLDVEPTHEWIPAIVDRLERARRDGRWRSTLENASALAALSRYQNLRVAGAPAVDFRGVVRGDGNESNFDSESPVVARFPPPSNAIEVQTEGQGDVYVAAIFSGLVSGGAATPYDRGLEVRRIWRDAEGKVLDPAAPLTLAVGDIVQVEVSLEAPQSIDHIAIVDALPGGCEVENPRLATSVTFGRRDQSPWAQPSRVEFLDDRVILFASAGRKSQSFFYALRVTGLGSFAVPPIQASCMYDESLASLFGGGSLDVR